MMLKIQSRAIAAYMTIKTGVFPGIQPGYFEFAAQETDGIVCVCVGKVLWSGKAVIKLQSALCPILTR